MNPLDVGGVSCREGTQVKKLKQKELGAEELDCGADLTRATEPSILCTVYGEMPSCDVFYPVDLM